MRTGKLRSDLDQKQHKDPQSHRLSTNRSLHRRDFIHCCSCCALCLVETLMGAGSVLVCGLLVGLVVLRRGVVFEGSWRLLVCWSIVSASEGVAKMEAVSDELISVRLSVVYPV
ncbi:hypothetical protein Droror1_Dr00007422 [Drosera rotundifolia]